MVAPTQISAMDFGKGLTETRDLVRQLSRKLFTGVIQGLGHALSFGLPSYYHACISIQGDRDAELAARFNLSSATLNALVNTWKTIRVASSFLCVG